MNKNNLPNNLYKLRKLKGLSQEEFAEQIRVSRQAISKWERGEAYPDTENLITISNVFGVSIDALLRSDNISFTNAIEASDSNNITPDNDEESSGGDTQHNSQQPHIHLTWDKHYSNDGKKSVFTVLLYTLPYPILITAVYLLLGFTINAWDWAWTFYVTIPLYYSLISAFKHRSLQKVDITCLCSFIFLLFGMLYKCWNPLWIIFLLIPIYYPIASVIDKARNGIDEDEDDDEDDDEDE